MGQQEAQRPKFIAFSPCCAVLGKFATRNRKLPKTRLCGSGFRKHLLLPNEAILTGVPELREHRQCVLLAAHQAFQGSQPRVAAGRQVAQMYSSFNFSWRFDSPGHDELRCVFFLINGIVPTRHHSYLTVPNATLVPNLCHSCL